MMNHLAETLKPIQERWRKSNLIQEKAVISSYTISIGTVLFLIEIVHDHRIWLGRKQIPKGQSILRKLGSNFSCLKLLGNISIGLPI